MNNTLHRLFDPFIAQQDYLWFLVALAWGSLVGACVLHWRAGKPFPKWIAVVGAAQVAGAVLSVARLVVPAADITRPPVWGEWGADVVVAVTVATLAWVCLGRARVLAVFVVCLATGWEMLRPLRLGEQVPVDASVVILAVMALATARAIWLDRMSGRSVNERATAAAAMALGAAVLFHQDGVLAELSDEARRWTDTSLFAFPAGLASLAAAAAALVGWTGLTLRELLLAPAWHRSVVRVACWLAIGVILAAFAGRLSRASFERGLMARAEAYSIAIDLPLVERWLEHEFKPRDPFTSRNYSRSIGLYRAPEIQQPEIRPVRDYFGRIETEDSDVEFAHVATIRHGDLVGALFPVDGHGDPDVIIRHRQAGGVEIAAWGTRSGFIAGPETLPWGSLVGAWAALVGSDNEMLGWLVVHVRVSRWSAIQAQARLQVFAVVGLGLGLIVLFERHQRRTAEIARAEHAARVAAAADEAKTAFLAQVSHELRTPIQSILGYGELLAGSPLDPRQRRWLEAQTAHGELLLRLVNDLLDAMSLKTGTFVLRPSPGDLHALIAEAVDSMKPRSEAKGLALTLSLPTRHEWLSFDAVRVRQVLQNLVGNAIKFTPAGSVSVELEIGEPEGGAAACRLIVRDTGPGIPRDRQAELFHPFVRLDHARNIEGAGLGLAISRALSRAMGGDVAVESDGSTGCTFIARWRFGLAVRTPEVRTTEDEALALAGSKILVADDNALVREFLLEALRARGADVRGVGDGAEALHILDTQDGFDTLVLDLSMPRMGGIEVAENLRERGRGLRIVGVSAHADQRDHAAAIAAGMNAFLTKPVRIEELSNAIRPESSRPGRSNERGLDVVRQKLRARFINELPAVRSRLEKLCRQQEWPAVSDQAHYLKGAAEILQFEEVATACGALHGAAAKNAAAAAEAAFAVLSELLTGAERQAVALSRETNLAEARQPTTNAGILRSP